jgi:hypothetical protein
VTARKYPSPEAFKQALEQRLRAATKTGAAFARKRQFLVFDRFLARLVQVLGNMATLKGGLVLELRLDRARTTKDIDLRLTGSSDGLLERLQEAARLDLGDFFTFEVGPDQDRPDIQGEGMVYDGLRFQATCTMAGKPYGQPFGVDIGFGDPILGAPDVVTADDTLGFAGISPPTLRLYPIETHIAEKLHAYTLPRARPNSRLKDLPDLALLASVKSLDAKQVCGRRSTRRSAFGRHTVYLRQCRIHQLRGRHPTRRWPPRTSSDGPRLEISRPLCARFSIRSWAKRLRRPGTPAAGHGSDADAGLRPAVSIPNCPAVARRGLRPLLSRG